MYRRMQEEKLASQNRQAEQELRLEAERASQMLEMTRTIGDRLTGAGVFVLIFPTIFPGLNWIDPWKIPI